MQFRSSVIRPPVRQAVRSTLRNPMFSGASGVSYQPIVPLTLFDSAGPDEFTDLDYSSTNAALTVTGAQAALNSASVLNINAAVKRSGAVVKHCLDHWTVTATVKLKSWPANARGLFVGLNSWSNFCFGAEIFRHGGGATWALHRCRLNGAAFTIDPLSGYNITGQPTAVVTAEQRGNLMHATVSYAGGANRTVTDTMIFVATSSEMPRMFSDWSVNFGSGELDVTALKVTADYKNARFAFLGDSLTQGRFASTYADGFAAKIRADYPGEVLIAGAPSATSADWLANIQSMTMMTPRRVFIMLGTNDIGMGVSLATYQANMTAIIAALEAAGSSVVLIAIPPRGYSPVRTDWNPWLQSLGKPYIDSYAALATGDALNAAYNSGDNVHFNTAGHAAEYTPIKSAIVANGW